MIAFYYILGTTLILAWVGLPLLMPRTRRVGGIVEEVFSERSDALLRALKKLYLQREEGKVAEDDFFNIERRLMTDLARLYKQNGVDPSVGAAPLDGVAEQAARSDEGHAAPAFRFCPSCGHELTGKPKFCSDCGTELKQK